jgi:Flp pilus assembly pilin Flp
MPRRSESSEIRSGDAAERGDLGLRQRLRLPFVESHSPHVVKRVSDNDNALSTRRQEPPGRGPLQTTYVEERQMKTLVTRFVREEEGQDLIEYSLLAALIAVGSIVVMNEVGDEIDAIFRRITAALQGA